LVKAIQDNPEIRFVATCRHFSDLNPLLLELGVFDEIFSLKPPSKQERYELIKNYAPE